MLKNDVTILLPALNEAESIGKTIDGIKAHGYNNIIVVDNWSDDGTYVQGEKHGATVAFELSRGKGNAVKKGLSLVKTPYAVMMDSDYTYPARYIDDIVELLEDYDVVMAERHIRLDNSMALTNLFGNRLLSLLGSILYWYWSSDICTGMWGFKKAVVDGFDIQSTNFTLEAELFIKSVSHRRRVARLPIAYRSRLGNRRSHLHIWHGFQICGYLIRHRVIGGWHDK